MTIQEDSMLFKGIKYGPYSGPEAGLPIILTELVERAPPWQVFPTTVTRVKCLIISVQAFSLLK